MTKTFLVTKLILITVASAFCGAVAFADDKPIAIAEIKHDGPVDFEKEVLPLLRRNCVACHNSAKAESDLILETPQAMLKGGAEGPAIEPGKGSESLLILLASRQRESFMPPPDNNVGAKPLTAEELGLIKLWIDQGASGEVAGGAGPVQWQPLPPGVNPIYAAAITADGRYVAASRANQIFIYHLATKQLVTRLTDPSLLATGVYDKAGVADLDLIQSLAFSPDGELLASGAFRTVKIWRRPRDIRVRDLAGIDSPGKSLARSSDGRWLAVGQDNGHVKVFDLSSGQIAKTLVGHAGPVTGVSFTKDGGQLATASQDKTVRIWNIADGAEVAKLETPAPVTAATFVSDDKQVAAAHDDHVIRIWGTPQPVTPESEAAPPQPAKELRGHGGPVTSIAANPAIASQILTGSHDGTLRLWDVNGGNQIRQMSHGGPVTSVAVRPDGQRFASAGANNAAKLWNAANGQQVAELKGDFETRYRADDATRAVALAKKIVDLANADLEEAKKRKQSEEDNAKKAGEDRTKAETELKQKTEALVKPQADKDAADQELATAQAELAAAEANKKTAEQELPKAEELLKAAQAARDAANQAVDIAAKALTEAQAKLTEAQAAAQQQPDNKELADAVVVAQKTFDEAQAAKQKTDEDKPLKEKMFQDATAARTAAQQAKQQADQVFSAAQNKTNQAQNKVNQVAAPHKKAVDERDAAMRSLQAAERSVERSKETIAAAEAGITAAESSLKQMQERHQQSEAGQKQAQEAIAPTEKPVAAVAFSPDGAVLASAGDDQVIFTWNSETGEAVDVRRGQGAALTHLAFIPSGDILALAANLSLVQWAGNPEWKLERVIGSPDSSDAFIDRVTALDFNHDGKLLATGGGEPSRSGELKIWSVENGNLVRAMPEAHSDTLFGVEFSPDGKHLATCGADRFMKVFNVENGEFVRSFEGHTHHVLDVSWRADGRVLATCGADNVVKAWNFATGDQIKTTPGFNKEVTSLRFLSDGNDMVVTASGDQNVRLNNVAQGNTPRTFGGAQDFLYTVDVTADGKIIIAGGQDSVLRVWRENGQAVTTFDPPKPPEPATSGG
jgi:WD40 repeat protein